MSFSNVSLFFLPAVHFSFLLPPNSSIEDSTHTDIPEIHKNVIPEIFYRGSSRETVILEIHKTVILECIYRGSRTQAVIPEINKTVILENYTTVIVCIFYF
jgi:hypothetical protein